MLGVADHQFHSPRAAGDAENRLSRLPRVEDLRGGTYTRGMSTPWGSVGPIFNHSYGRGTMKFVISDLKNPYIQMEKVWEENIFSEIFYFFKFFGKKKSIWMKMNPLGSFSTEGKKKISKRGSGWGVTPLEPRKGKKPILGIQVGVEDHFCFFSFCGLDN